MRNLFLFIGACLLCLPSFAQNKENTGSLKGTIVTSDNQPAALVSVQIKSIKKSALSNNDGAFTIKNIQPGNYEVELSSVGFQTITKSVVIDKTITTTLNIQLEISQFQLNDVTVTATRRMYVVEGTSSSLRLNTPLIETPQNITVTTQQTIKDIGALSLSEIFRTSSGIIKGNAQQDISVNLRGTQVTSSILRNGVGSGYWYNQEPDAAMIERVEFVKGPAGFMISNTEPGGLINTVTKQPTHERIAAVNFGYGSWNMFRTSIDLGGEFKKDGALTYRLNAGMQQQSEFYQFGSFKKQFVAAALKYDVDEKTAITVEYNYLHGRSISNGQYLPTIKGEFFALPNNFGLIDPNTPGTNSADNYYRLNVKHKINEDWNLNAQAAYVNGPWGGYMMYLNGISENYDTLYRAMAMTDWQNKLYTAQVFVDGTFNTGANINHKVLAGIDYGNTSVVSQGGGTWDESGKYGLSISDPTYFIPVDSLKNFPTNQWTSQWGTSYSSLYVQDHIKLYKKLIVTLAGRYTYSTTWADYNSPYEQVDKKFVPRFGLTYLFADNLSAYALYDGAFIPQNGKSFSGKLFDPLTGNNTEVGVKGLFFHKKLSLGMSAYRIVKNNALTTDPEHPDFQIQTGQIVSKGIEFDLNGNLTNNLSVIANYAYTDARITKDNDKLLEGMFNAGSTPHLINLFLKYRFLNGPIKGISVGAGAQYTDKVSGGLNWYNGAFAGWLPKRTIYEASVGYTYNKFYINMNLFNMTNKRYAASGNSMTETEWQYQPGDPINFRLDFGIRL